MIVNRFLEAIGYPPKGRTLARASTFSQRSGYDTHDTTAKIPALQSPESDRGDLPSTSRSFSRKAISHNAIAIIISTCSLLVAFSGLLVTIMVNPENLAKTIAAVSKVIAKVCEKTARVAEQYVKLSREIDRAPVVEKTDDAAVRLVPKLAVPASGVEVRATPRLTERKNMAATSSIQRRRSVGTNGTNPPNIASTCPSSQPIRFIEVHGDIELEDLLTKHPSWRRVFEYIEQNHWIYGSSTEKVVQYVPSPHVGCEAEFDEWLNARRSEHLQLVEVRVPNSWMPNDLFAHLDRWVVNSTSLKLSDIQDMSNVLVFGTGESRNGCSIGGSACLFLTGSWNPKTFSDFSVWSGHKQNANEE